MCERATESGRAAAYVCACRLNHIWWNAKYAAILEGVGRVFTHIETLLGRVAWNSNIVESFCSK